MFFHRFLINALVVGFEENLVDDIINMIIK